MRIDAQPMSLQRPQGADAARADKVARDMEGLFAQMMVRSMRETVPGDAMFPGAAGQFRDLHDQQISKSLTEGRGLGLASMIARQIAREQSPAPAPAAGPLQPLPITPKTEATPLAARAAMLPLNDYARPLAVRPLELAASRSAALPRANWIPAEDVPRLQPAVRLIEPQARPETAPAAPSVSAVRTDRAAASRAEAFVEKVWPHAQRVGRELGVDPRAIVAQAALETGWGRSTISRGAADGEGGKAHNYFGIKAGSRWSGETVATRTQEFVDGAFRTEKAAFRAYDGVAESFADYARLLKQSPRYAEALGAGTDIQGFAHALQRAGYATDPAYAKKIESIANGPTLERALARLDIDDARGPALRNAMLAGAVGGF